MAEPDATDTEQESRDTYECLDCGDEFYSPTEGEIHEAVSDHFVEGL